jgi:hypothetical protein
MDIQFLKGMKLPDYLEEALTPFWWSSCLSDKFKDSIIFILYSEPKYRRERIDSFIETLKFLKFLDQEFKIKLISGLVRWEKEANKGDKKDE